MKISLESFKKIHRECIENEHDPNSLIRFDFLSGEFSVGGYPRGETQIDLHYVHELLGDLPVEPTNLDVSHLKILFPRLDYDWEGEYREKQKRIERIDVADFKTFMKDVYEDRRDDKNYYYHDDNVMYNTETGQFSAQDLILDTQPGNITICDVDYLYTLMADCDEDAFDQNWEKTEIAALFPEIVEGSE